MSGRARGRRQPRRRLDNDPLRVPRTREHENALRARNGQEWSAHALCLSSIILMYFQEMYVSRCARSVSSEHFASRPRALDELEV